MTSFDSVWDTSLVRFLLAAVLGLAASCGRVIADPYPFAEPRFLVDSDGVRVEQEVLVLRGSPGALVASEFELLNAGVQPLDLRSWFVRGSDAAPFRLSLPAAMQISSGQRIRIDVSYQAAAAGTSHVRTLDFDFGLGQGRQVFRAFSLVGFVDRR